MVKISPYINSMSSVQKNKKTENNVEIKQQGAEISNNKNFTNPIVTAPLALSFHGVFPESKNSSGCIITPKEFPPADYKATSLFEEYPEGKNFPYYDDDNARFSDKANAEIIPIKRDINEEVIYVSNFDDPSGTIAGSSSLDKTLYTDRLAQCAALAVVDKAHNTQSLIHVYPGYGVKDNKQILEHVLKASNPNDLELSVIPGYSGWTASTVQFILDTLKELTPEVEPKLYNFPHSDDIKIFQRGLLLKDGQLFCCEEADVKNRNTNPKEYITYCKYELAKFAKAEDLTDVLEKTDVPKKYDKAELIAWAKDNNLKCLFYNMGFDVEFMDDDDKVVREVSAGYEDTSLVCRDLRSIYDSNGNLVKEIIYRDGHKPEIVSISQKS